jgi:Hemolysins and related proteins containing CBS domains
MVGICTLEDLIEEIVGEIEDEFDVAEEPIVQVDEDTYRVDGMFPIDEFNDRFGRISPTRTTTPSRASSSANSGAPGARRRRVAQRSALRRARGGGNRIERMAVTFLKRPERKRESEELLDPEEDEIE